MERDTSLTAADEPTLADKVEFLSRPEAYPHAVPELIRRETHMSWVFLAGDKVYKLKKPVRFPYLDFSTLGRREAACRAEFSLNRRLAPDVYIGVTPLVVSPRGLSLGGAGSIVDWLVVMRRLDDRWVLEQVLREGRLEIGATRPAGHDARAILSTGSAGVRFPRLPSGRVAEKLDCEPPRPARRAVWPAFGAHQTDRPHSTPLCC